MDLVLVVLVVLFVLAVVGGFAISHLLWIALAIILILFLLDRRPGGYYSRRSGRGGGV
jgi:hypothetical protein